MKRILVFLCALLLWGCKVCEPVVERVVENHTEVVHDSVDRWHTHYEYLLGDTVRVVDSVMVDRWLREVVVDSVRDSIPYPVEVVRVEKEYPFLWAFVVLAAVVAIWLFVKIRLWRRG